MGYYADYEGIISLRKLNKQDENIFTSKMKKFVEKFGGDLKKTNDEELCFAVPGFEQNSDYELDDGAYCINLWGNEKYHSDEWEEWLDDVYEFIDPRKQNEIEFSGEDGCLWRFIAKEKGFVEQQGRVVYD